MSLALYLSRVRSNEVLGVTSATRFSLVPSVESQPLPRRSENPSRNRASVGYRSSRCDHRIGGLSYIRIVSAYCRHRAVRPLVPASVPNARCRSASKHRCGRWPALRSKGDFNSASCVAANVYCTGATRWKVGLRAVVRHSSALGIDKWHCLGSILLWAT